MASPGVGTLRDRRGRGALSCRLYGGDDAHRAASACAGHAAGCSRAWLRVPEPRGRAQVAPGSDHPQTSSQPEPASVEIRADGRWRHSRGKAKPRPAGNARRWAKNRVIRTISRKFGAASAAWPDLFSRRGAPTASAMRTPKRATAARAAVPKSLVDGAAAAPFGTPRPVVGCRAGGAGLAHREQTGVAQDVRARRRTLDPDAVPRS